jgi:hypothetical protein
MDQKTRDRIAREESGRFLDENFSQLDLSGFPDLANPKTESFESEDRFGFNNVDLAGLASVNRLKDLIESPDDATLAELAAETGDPNLIAKVNDARAEEVARQFVAAHHDYYRTDENRESMILCLAYNVFGVEYDDAELAEQKLISGGHWTLQNLNAVFAALTREGVLETAPGTARNLTGSEQLSVARLAQSGQPERAIEKYLELALGDSPLDTEILNDPDYRDLCDRAVAHVFELSTPDYSPTPSRRKFLQDFAAGRPLTLRMLEHGWQLCKKAEADEARGLVLSSLNEPEPSPQNLDTLGDQEIDSLYHKTLREWANSVRRPAAMYV